MAAAHEILKHETDYYLDYTFGETVRQLKNSFDGVYLPDDEGALASVIARLSNEDLLRAETRDAILVERIERPGLGVEARTNALLTLADRRGSDLAAEALAALRRLNQSGRPATAAGDLGFLLASSGAARLANDRGAFEALAAETRIAEIRRAALAAMTAADGGPDAVWSATAGDAASRVALIESIGMHPDAEFRSAFAAMLFGAIRSESTDRRTLEAAIGALPLMNNDRAAESFELLAGRLSDGGDMQIAARAIVQLPRESWSAEPARRAVEGALRWARSQTGRRQQREDLAEIVQAGIELTSVAPEPESSRLRSELQALAPRVVVVRAVRDRMRFDVTRITVRAGQSIDIILENADVMPHNLVVTEPGAREAIGRLADRMTPAPDRRGRAYVPDDPRVIAATAMVDPGGRVRLRFTAPEAAGEYEFVCTYPEHWMTMFGRLEVVARAPSPPDESGG
jgi:azurin